MGIETWASILLGIASTVIAGVILIFIRYAMLRWRRIDNKHELYFIKTDCMITAFKNMNHGVGQEFGIEYDKAFEARKKEVDFINKV